MISLSLPLFKIQLCGTLDQGCISLLDIYIYISKYLEAFHFLDTYKGWKIAQINDLGQVLNRNVLVLDWVQLGLALIIVVADMHSNEEMPARARLSF